MKKSDGFRGSLMTVLPPPIVAELANNPYTKGLFITHIGYFPHAEHHFRQRDEGLDEYVLLCCTEGKGWIKYSDEKISLEAGKAFVIPAGLSHSYGADSDDPWTIYWLHFKGEMAAAYARNLSGIIPFRLDSSPGSPKLLFKEMLSEFEGTRSGSYISTILYHLLGVLAHGKEYSEAEPDKNPVVEKCKEFISRNMARDINLSDIVDVSGVSTTQCANLFRIYCGATPMAYLSSLRIGEACRLLELTSLNIKQISALVGISDPYYFSRLFRKHTGVSPSAFRTGRSQQ